MAVSIDAPTATLTVRYFAAAGAAAGVDEEQISLPLPATVQDLLDACVLRHGVELGAVLERCSFLLDEVAVHERTAEVRSASALDVLPPFAGG